MRFSILAITIFLIMEIAIVQSWLLCNRFADFFHFSSFDLSLRLIEGIHNDGGIPIFLVRFFHNKAVGSLLDVYISFVRFWDITFLMHLLSLVGIFGFIYGIRDLIVFRKNLLLFVFVFLTFLLQMVEVLINPPLPFVVKLGLLLLSFLSVSLFGLWRFTAKKENFRVAIFLSLASLSIWWYSIFPAGDSTYCMR